MSLDYEQERRMMAEVEALGWRWDKALGLFMTPGEDFVSYDQACDAWLKAQDGIATKAEEIEPVSKAVAQMIATRANDQTANDDNG